MVTTRKNCFETNSSSMHSLAIVKKNRTPDKYETLSYMVDDEGVLDLAKHCDEEDMYYERYPFRILTNEVDKARYISGILRSTNDKNGVRRFKYMLQKRTGCKRVKDWIEAWDQDYKTDKWIKKRQYFWTSWSNDTGEDILHFMKRKNLSIEDVIFNPKCVIFTDGDEYNKLGEMFELGLISEDNILDISSGINFWMDRDIYIDIDDIDRVYENNDYPNYIEAKRAQALKVDKPGIVKIRDWKKNSSSINKYKKTYKLILELHQLGFNIVLDDDPDYKPNEEKIEKYMPKLYSLMEIYTD